MPKENIKTDFNVEEITKTTEQHEKSISEFNTRISDLENKLSNPEQLANVIETATKDSKKLDKIFSSIFCEMINKDEDVKNAIKGRIDNIDRGAVFSILKKWGEFVYAVILITIGAIITLVISRFSK